MGPLETHLEEKKHIVWDWNGTLLDDVDLCVEIINEMLVLHKMAPVTRVTYREKFRFPVEHYYRAIGFDFDKVSFEILSRQFITKYHDRVVDCPLYEGARDLLTSLKKSGKTMSILSAARETELRQLAQQHDIEGHFKMICGLSDHYAVSKIERGHQLIASLKIPATDIIMVGDTDHDIEVASALGIDLLLLGDGHQHHSRLEPLHPKVLPNRYVK